MHPILSKAEKSKSNHKSIRFIGIKPKAIFRAMDVLFDTCRTHIAYIKKAYLMTRNDCARLGRKFINFSKVPNFHKAAIIWDLISLKRIHP